MGRDRRSAARTADKWLAREATQRCIICGRR